MLNLRNIYLNGHLPKGWKSVFVPADREGRDDVYEIFEGRADHAELVLRQGSDGTFTVTHQLRGKTGFLETSDESHPFTVFEDAADYAGRLAREFRWMPPGSRRRSSAG